MVRSGMALAHSSPGDEQDDESRVRAVRSAIGPRNMLTPQDQAYVICWDRCRALDNALCEAELTLAHTTRSNRLDARISSIRAY
jgi:hypothetical protein